MSGTSIAHKLKRASLVAVGCLFVQFLGILLLNRHFIQNLSDTNTYNQLTKTVQNDEELVERIQDVLAGNARLSSPDSTEQLTRARLEDAEQAMDRLEHLLPSDSEIQTEFRRANQSFLQLKTTTLLSLQNSSDRESHTLLSSQFTLQARESLERINLAIQRKAKESFLKAYAARHVLPLFGGGFVIALALVLAALAKRLIHQITEPLRELIAVTERIAQGDTTQQASIDGKDEIGELARSFNAMTAKLRRSHEDLERKVSQRTKDLVDNNLLLKAQIVERQQIEKRLKLSAQNLMRSNQELQDFASVASHDLQEPLRKVQVFSDRLKTKCAESLGDQGRDYLDRMRNAVARMQSLINDLLNYSRVTTKAQPFVQVAIAQVATDVVSDLEARIEQVQGKVEIGALPTIEADPVQMRQLLQNLIGNALKFHKKDVPPVIRVYAEAMDADDAEPFSIRANTCRIVVADNGIGFDEKYAERIFKVFERLHGREEYEGTGIGLAICRKIVERHGGSIAATSVPDQGTTFTLTLPYQQIKGDNQTWPKTDDSLPSLLPTTTPTIE